MTSMRVLLGVSTLFMASCAPKLFEPTRVEFQHEAGSTHLSVLPIMKWEDVYKELEPQFSRLKGDQAIDQVLPTTQTIEQAYLEQFMAKLSLGIDGAVAPDLPDTGETSPQAEANASGEQSVLRHVLARADPILMRQLATALVQETAMLNNYLHNAKTYEGEYEAYVVRLQIGVMPMARNMPYDTYSTLSFFGGPSALSSDLRVYFTESRKPVNDRNPEHYTVVAKPIPGNQVGSIYRPRAMDAAGREAALAAATLTPLDAVDEATSPLIRKVEKDASLVGNVAQAIINLLKHVEAQCRAPNTRLQHDLANAHRFHVNGTTVTWREVSLDAMRNLINSSNLTKPDRLIIANLLDRISESVLHERALIDQHLHETKIIPLLVTDNLEASDRSRTIEKTLQLALAVSGAGGGIPFGGQLQQRLDQLQTVLGRDLNSTLTVGRISDNTVRVRLGAMQQVGARYATVPRTHYISLLVLVPRAIAQSDGEMRSVRVMARTDFVDSETGAILLPRTDKQISHLVCKAVACYQTINKDKPSVYNTTEFDHILGAVQRADYREYHKLIIDKQDQHGITAYEQLYNDLTTIALGSKYHYTTARLPELPDKRASRSELPRPADVQHVALVDDGKTATVTIVGGTRLADAGLIAQLKIIHQVGANGHTVVIPPSAIAFPLDDAVQITFPSPVALGLMKVNERAEIVLSSRYQLSDSHSHKIYLVAAPKAPEPKASVTITTTPGSISTVANRPQPIEFHFKPEQGNLTDYYVKFSTAVDSFLPADALGDVDQQFRQILKNQVTVKFDSLISGKPIEIEIFTKQGQKYVKTAAGTSIAVTSH